MAIRTFGLLCLGLSLAGCVSVGEETYAPPGMAPPETMPPVPASPPLLAKVALLAPLSGANAGAGQPIEQAAQLALAAPGSPALTVEDTGGTASGATEAAHAALGAGAAILIGPLTSTETAAAAAIARPAGAPVLAFTSDREVAATGVWALGLTPAQQVDRLVALAKAEGKTRIAALLPRNSLGDAMGRALALSAAAQGLPVPRIATYGVDMASLTDAVQTVADYADRRGPIDQKLREARRTHDKALYAEAEAEMKQALPPVPFDALLLADTGTPLAELATLLPFYDVSGVQIMGPALWAQPEARAAAPGLLQGAWYAGFDPDSGQAFSSDFSGKYGAPPPAIARFAFDAAEIARACAHGTAASLTACLTRPEGFAGANGTLRLMPDGTSQRSLAVFAIDHDTQSVAAPPLAAPALPAS